MTKLTKLVLKNFKSFKKAEIPISKGFTAIVGSNGSGKSNVLDALLFVLGITSLKTLRASKLTDLVNSGCKEGYAKVDLSIKHDNRDYEVSRMVDKQGKSIYRLDGKRTTLNEINSLLLELGIDVSGHNIVTQGDITKIIEMSGLERRIIIDNIAGLSEFDAKKEEAIKELDKVDLRIKEATIIMNERNAFLLELEDEMKAAKEYDELEKEKKRIKATVIGKELYNIEKRMNEVQSEIIELDKQKALCDEKVITLRNGLSEQKEKANEMNRQIMKDSESLYITIGRAYEEKKAKLLLEKEKLSLQQDIINRGEKKNENNKNTLEQFEKEKNELKNRIIESEAEIKIIEGNIKQLLDKKNSLEKIVKEKNTEMKKYEEDYEEKTKALDNINKILNDIESSIRNISRDKESNEKRKNELTLELEKVEQNISNIKEKQEKVKTITQGKDLEKELLLFEKQLEEKLEQKNKNAAIREEEINAINNLGRAESKCPVCDTSINHDKKEDIISHKNKHIEEMKNKEKLIEEEISKIRENITNTKKNIVESSRLLVECSVFDELEEKKNQLTKSIKELQTLIEQQNIEKLSTEKKENEEKKQILFNEKESSKEKLHAFRSQNIFEDFSAVTKAIETELGKKSLAESKVSNIENELNKALAKEDSILKENKEFGKNSEHAKKEVEEIRVKIEELQKEVDIKDAELKEAKKKSTALLNEKEKLDRNIEREEKEIMIEASKARKFELRINEFNIEKSKIEVRQIDLKEEQKNYLGVEQIAEKTVDSLKERLEVVEKKLLDIGAVNLKAMDNFTELKKEVEEIQQKATKLSEERLAVLDMIDKIEVKRTAVFMDCFNEVNKNFKDMFFKFFNGEGNLTFENQEKPLESGLLIEAKYKLGKLQNIDSMSGGEKTLTALAFMFAIQLYSPAPFYAFDEADAALDKENSSKMGNLIEIIAQKSQFISVTHNDTITKKADQIIGVARANDGSSVIGLKLKNTEQ